MKELTGSSWGSGFAVRTWDTDGTYKFNYGCPLTHTNTQGITPGQSYMELNAASINPKDDTVYMALVFNFSYTFLVRIGPSAATVNDCLIRYVAKIGYTQAGTFDSDGFFLYYSMGKLRSVQNLHNYPEYENSGYAPDYTDAAREYVDAGGNPYLSNQADLVPLVGDLEYSGTEVKYVLGMRKNNLNGMFLP